VDPRGFAVGLLDVFHSEYINKLREVPNDQVTINRQCKNASYVWRLLAHVTSLDPRVAAYFRGMPDCVGLVVDLYLGTSSPRSQYHFQRFSIPSGVDISGMIGFLCNVIVSSTVKFASFTNFMVLDDRTFLRALAMEATTKQLVNKIGPVFAHFSRENDTFSADVLKKLFKWMTDGEHDSDQMRPYLRLLNYLCKLDDSLQQARQENIMRNMLYSFRDCCDDAHLWKKADMLLDFIIRFSTSFESCKQYCFNQEGDVALLIDMAIEWLEEYAKKNTRRI